MNPIALIEKTRSLIAAGDISGEGVHMLSTSGMLQHVEQNPTGSYIVATETGLLHRLEQLYPGRTFVPVSRSAYCPNMKLTTLEKAITALRDCLNEVSVPPAVRERALRSVARMVE